MDVNTGIQSRQILNLRANRFLNNEEKLYGEKLMKSGFLNLSTEEYGYYNIDLKWDSDFGIGLPILSLCTLGILQIFGVPSEVNTYTIVASLEIFDSNGNIVREFKERGTFKQAAGWYYGRDNTKKAGREFSKLFSAIQKSIDDQSAFINKKLMDAG
ncbi:MAG: hypothetical protein LBP74_06885, partial [Treponema sp.]|nr:hypothetical protein [Treponema sp.]